MSEETITGTRSCDRSVVGFLSSLVAHLLLLLVLALMVQSPVQVTTSKIVHFGDSESSNFSLQTIDRLDLDVGHSNARGESLVPIVDLPLIHAIDDERLYPIAMSNPRTTPDDPSDEHTSPPERPKEPNEGVRFFDTHAYGSSFVYVLDISGSMWAGQGRRMRRAQQELIRSINDLQPHHSFEIVLYNERAYTFGAPQLRLATPENKLRYKRWINLMHPHGGTMPGEALRIAGELNPDAVFFLSDGEFVFATTATPEENLEEFLQSFISARGRHLQNPQANNKLPKSILDGYPVDVVVHTIAFENQENRDIMQTIAKEKSGQFRFIPAPVRPGIQRR